MIRDGGYASDTRWSFGRKAALIDLACLIAPRLLGEIARRRASGGSTAASQS
jgi:hypothetical protein